MITKKQSWKHEYIIQGIDGIDQETRKTYKAATFFPDTDGKLIL